MPGYEATVIGLLVEALPKIMPQPESVQITDLGEGSEVLHGFRDGRGRWRSICIGAPRGEAMCTFSLSCRPVRMVKPPGPPSLKIGFVQNLIGARRIATYGQPNSARPLFAVLRDASGIGNGVLDCGNDAPPWFQGKFAPFTPPGSQHPPAVLHAFDNPRWSIPLALDVPDKGQGVLKTVEMNDVFRLYAVASDGKNYWPIASVDWGTEITFRPNPGPVPTGRAPSGSWTGRKVWANRWQRPVPPAPIVTGQTANKLLQNKLV